MGAAADGRNVRTLAQPRLDATGQDALALTVLSAVLDGYDGARLDRALTQPADHVADSAGSHYGLSGRGPQLFMLQGVPASGTCANGRTAPDATGVASLRDLALTTGLATHRVSAT